MLPLLPVLVVLVGACLVAASVQAAKPALRAQLGPSPMRPWTLRLLALALSMVLAAVAWVPGVSSGLLPDSPRTWVVVGAVVCAMAAESAYRWAKSLLPRVLEAIEARVLAWVGG